MSIKHRLAEKTGDLVTAAATGLKADSSAPDSLPGEIRMPRTGPGQMLAYRSHMQENNQRVEELQDRLKEFEGTSIACQVVRPQTDFTLQVGKSPQLQLCE